MFKVGDKVTIVNCSGSINPNYRAEVAACIGTVFEITALRLAAHYPNEYWLDGLSLPTYKGILSDAVELYTGNTTSQFPAGWQTYGLPAQEEKPRAEITQGRFITDKERALIETRIALRKKLHGG